MLPCCVVGVSELWERFVGYVEAGSALLHSLGFVVVFSMSSCTGVAGLDVSQQYYCVRYFLRRAPIYLIHGKDGNGGR